jgi:hypothetical protein
MPDIDKIFTGSIPKLYEAHPVPLIFEPYAADLKQRVGVVTHALATIAIDGLGKVATDLHQAMLDEAAANEACRRCGVDWWIGLRFDNGGSHGRPVSGT